MYIFKDKILGHGNIRNDEGRPFVVIRSEDYPNDSSMTRSTYVGSIARALELGRDGSDFSNYGSPGIGYYVAVEVGKFRAFHPSWCLTEDDLMAQYEAKQRDDETTRARLVEATKVNIFLDPQLKAMASTIWSSRLEKTQVAK